MIREIKENELNSLLKLYLFLHEDSVPAKDSHLFETWKKIINDPNHHIIVAIEDGKIVASCVCIIIPNLTRGVKPYAIIENVVTHNDYRRKGYTTKCINYAQEIAISNDCYKIMLLTSHKEQKMLDFYVKAGFNSEDKVGFVQWI